MSDDDRYVLEYDSDEDLPPPEDVHTWWRPDDPLFMTEAELDLLLPGGAPVIEPMDLLAAPATPDLLEYDEDAHPGPPARVMDPPEPVAAAAVARYQPVGGGVILANPFFEIDDGGDYRHPIRVEIMEDKWPQDPVIKLHLGTNEYGGAGRCRELGGGSYGTVYEFLNRNGDDSDSIGVKMEPGDTATERLVAHALQEAECDTVRVRHIGSIRDGVNGTGAARAAMNRLARNTPPVAGREIQLLRYG